MGNSAARGSWGMLWNANTGCSGDAATWEAGTGCVERWSVERQELSKKAVAADESI